MTRHTLSNPTLPTQAEIDRAIGRAHRLRSRAFLNAFAAIFGGDSKAPTTKAAYPR